MKSEYFCNTKNYLSHTILKQHRLCSCLALKTIIPLLTAHVIHSWLNGSWRGPNTRGMAQPLEGACRHSPLQGGAQEQHISTYSFISINTGSTVPSVPPSTHLCDCKKYFLIFTVLHYNHYQKYLGGGERFMFLKHNCWKEQRLTCCPHSCKVSYSLT